jgi:hypothetical protein
MTCKIISNLDDCLNIRRVKQGKDVRELGGYLPTDSKVAESAI